MSFAYRARHLQGVQLTKALILVRLGCSDLDDEAWFRFTETCALRSAKGEADACGVVGIEDSQSYILGLFCFRVHRTSPTGPLLDCDHFIVPDMVRSDVPLRELTLAAEELAREHGCTRIRLAIPGLETPHGAAADRFRVALHDNGYDLESLRFEKKIGVRPAGNVRHANA